MSRLVASGHGLPYMCIKNKLYAGSKVRSARKARMSRRSPKRRIFKAVSRRESELTEEQQKQLEAADENLLEVIADVGEMPLEGPTPIDSALEGVLASVP